MSNSLDPDQADILTDLILETGSKLVCKGYQQTTLAGKEFKMDLVSEASSTMPALAVALSGTYLYS